MSHSVNSELTFVCGSPPGGAAGAVQEVPGLVSETTPHRQPAGWEIQMDEWAGAAEAGAL